MSDMISLIAELYKKPDLNPILFKIGQKVRVLNNRSNDGQTPVCWDGAIAEVVSYYTTGLHKEHWYKLKHLGNGNISEFEETEIDQRYARKIKNDTK